MRYSCCYVAGPAGNPLLGLIVAVAAEDWVWSDAEQGHGGDPAFQLAVAIVDLTLEQALGIGLRRLAYDSTLGEVHASDPALWPPEDDPPAEPDEEADEWL